MKILFYDKFFDSLIQLPKTTQKKVNDFQKKFRENSKSSGIHLEPISTFKDQSLRSARIDKTYRAILKVPESGDIFYLLWVDHHDKAYEWAQNKVFQWNDETQSMQVFIAPEVTSSSPNAKSIYNQKDTFLSQMDKGKLLKLGVPEVLLPSIEKVNTIADLEKLENFIPADVFENLFYLLDGAPIDDIIRDIEEGKVLEDGLEQKVNSLNNQRSFIELTDDSLFNDILSGNLEKWKYYLHPSQSKLVNGNFKGSVKVSGGAGTGKTVAAIHRLKHISKISDPNESILFTTYTKALTDNLNFLIKGFEINNKNLTIMNIDKLVLDLIKKYKITENEYKVFEFDSVRKGIDLWDNLVSSELVEFSPDFYETEYKNIVLYHNVKSLDEYLRTPRRGRTNPLSRRQRKNVWTIIESFSKMKSKQNRYYKDELYNMLFDYLTKNDIYLYDYCIVDELQDFSNVELRLIRRLVRVKENDLFMVGDPMQKIYDRMINFSSIGINVRGKRSRRLRINYRTTEEIKKLALSVIQDCHYDNFDGDEEEKSGYVSLFHGKVPLYKTFKTHNEECNFVLESINKLIENGYQYNEIAICARTKNSLKDVRNILHQSDVPYEFNSFSKSTNAIPLLTLHSTKGLEFKHVFLVDINRQTIPKLPYDFDTMNETKQQEHLQNEKSLLYVAISRAIENVVITGIGEKSEYIKLD